MTTAMPFLKLYYSGVIEREKATTITIKRGVSVDNFNFALPTF
ncbi:MAG TPA: hypothetical protein VLB68_05350 [Pyrinomonadaceae bacterium]|nr:hypothetical protein [Pyrinomonadaceae bacterium]